MFVNVTSDNKTQQRMGKYLSLPAYANWWHLQCKKAQVNGYSYNINNGLLIINSGNYTESTCYMNVQYISLLLVQHCRDTNTESSGWQAEIINASNLKTYANTIN